MKAIVLCGVSGVGKTHYRQNPENCINHLLCVDIADVYREAKGRFPDYPPDWQTATEQVLRKIKAAFEVMEEHSCWSPPYTVVVEGYFLPGTPSRKMLDDGLRILGIKAEYHLLWAPFDVCLERLQAQKESSNGSAAEIDGRIELLYKCWRPKNE